MKKTHARRKFKKLLGQANHFLITSLIGLDYIGKTDDIKKPDEFSTSWEPHNPKISALRSREYILNSSLAWAVDCLDSYFIMIHRKPKMILNNDFTVAMSKAKRSVYLKAVSVGKHFSIDYKIIAMIEILITWRNNLTHNFAENKISTESIKVLEENTDYIKENFAGLDIKSVLEKAYNGKSPSFKECASLINATHKFVEYIDEEILKQLDKYDYARNVYYLYFQEDTEKRISKLYGKEIDFRFNIIENILKNYGAFDSVDEDIINKLLSLNINDIRQGLKENDETSIEE